jgi:hypothetical protein
MDLKPFKVVALPFPQSSEEAEFVEYGTDEDDAMEKFMKRYPAYRIKSVEETLV